MADNCGKVHGRLGRSEIRREKRKRGNRMGRGRDACARTQHRGGRGERGIGSQTRCRDDDSAYVPYCPRTVYDRECVTNKCLPAARRTGICIRTHNAAERRLCYPPPLSSPEEFSPSSSSSSSPSPPPSLPSSSRSASRVVAFFPAKKECNANDYKIGIYKFYVLTIGRNKNGTR